MKVQRARNTIGNKNLAWHSQIYIATAKSNPAQLVADQCGTGADSAALEVIIQFPVGIHMCLRSYPETRDQRREMPRTGEEGNASEVGGCSEHVAASIHQCSAKGGIEKILLPQFPTHQFVSGGPRRARSGLSRFGLLLVCGGVRCG